MKDEQYVTRIALEIGARSGDYLRDPKNREHSGIYTALKALGSVAKDAVAQKELQKTFHSWEKDLVSKDTNEKSRELLRHRAVRLLAALKNALTPEQILQKLGYAQESELWTKAGRAISEQVGM